MCSQYFGEKGADAVQNFFWRNALSVYKYEATGPQRILLAARQARARLGLKAEAGLF